jgi:hypothetical protein
MTVKVANKDTDSRILNFLLALLERSRISIVSEGVLMLQDFAKRDGLELLMARHGTVAWDGFAIGVELFAIMTEFPMNANPKLVLEDTGHKDMRRMDRKRLRNFQKLRCR